MFDPKPHHRALQKTAAAGLAAALAFATAGCKSKSAEIQATAAAAQTGQDPAEANLATPYTGGTAGGYTNGQQTPAPVRVLGQTASYPAQSSSESFETQQPAPIIRQAPPTQEPAIQEPAIQEPAIQEPEQFYPVPQAQNGNASYAGNPGNDQQGYNDAEEAGDEAIAGTDQAPPPLPEYDQPPAPEDNDIWTPGYWNYASTGYFWVPGVWCAPPFYGALWTPPYWAYRGGHYRFHRGYWGRHVGYYGGVNYGFGYIGIGYFGGYWHNHDFFYNRAVTNVNVHHIHNVYNRTVVYNNRAFGPRSSDRISYNGGRGGLSIQPRPAELAALHEDHYAPVPAQRENRIAAAGNRAQFFAVDHGHPANAFRTAPVGQVNRIAAAPERAPFNHPGALTPALEPHREPGPGQPANTAAALPGRQFGPADGRFHPMPSTPTVNRPATLASQLPAQADRRDNLRPFNDHQAIPPGTRSEQAARTGQFNRPGLANTPANTNPPREFHRPLDLNRPGLANTPANTNPPREFNRPFNPNRQGTLNQPGYANNPPRAYERRGTEPQPVPEGNGFGQFSRPATPAQPGTTLGAAPGGSLRHTYPGEPAGSLNRPAAQDRIAPPANISRPENFHRNTPPNNLPQPENPYRNTPPNNIPRPENFHRNVAPSQPFPQPAGRPAPEINRPPMEQPQRPTFEIHRSAPAPEIRPQSQPGNVRPTAPAALSREQAPRPNPGGPPRAAGEGEHRR